jgi:hypothetical protein
MHACHLLVTHVAKLKGAYRTRRPGLTATAAEGHVHFTTNEGVVNV